MTGRWSLHSEVRGLADRVLAALPRSIGPTDAVAGSLVALDGSRPDWDDAVLGCLHEGALGVLVERPCPLPLARLDALTAVGAPVLLRRPLLDDPVLSGASGRRVTADGALLLSSEQRFRPGAAPASALLNQLAAVRRLVAPVARVHSASLRASGWAVTGELDGGAAVDLAGVLTAGAASSLSLQLLRPPERLSVLIHPDRTARPAEIRVTDLDGELLLPTSYESAERWAWRRLLAAASKGRPLDDVRDLRRDLELLARIEAQAGESS